jgi:hypothetical protein
LRLRPLLLLLPVSAVLVAQSSAPVFYAESFRQGSTHVIEEKFDLKLTPQDRTYTEHIKDPQGFDHYVLSVAPLGPQGDTTITSWRVRLTDLTHRLYPNILLNSLRQDAASDPENQLGQLNPSSFATVPIKAKRIIKVDAFYLVLQVKSYHFTPIDSPYLDSMTVSIEFTNSDPRTPTEIPK